MIENIKSIAFAVYKTIFLIHVFSCAWIYIKFYEESLDEIIMDSTLGIKVKGRLNSSIEGDEKYNSLFAAMSVAYWSADYFIMTTMTSVGYGDTNGDT